MKLKFVKLILKQNIHGNSFPSVTQLHQFSPLRLTVPLVSFNQGDYSSVVNDRCYSLSRVVHLYMIDQTIKLLNWQYV